MYGPTIGQVFHVLTLCGNGLWRTRLDSLNYRYRAMYAKVAFTRVIERPEIRYTVGFTAFKH